MDSKQKLSDMFTKVLENVFNTQGHYLPNHFMNPKHESFTEIPFQEKPTIDPLREKIIREYMRSINENPFFKSVDKRPIFWQIPERTTIGPSRKETTFTPALETTTARPHFNYDNNISHERTTRRPFTRPPTRYNPIYERPNHNSIGRSINQPGHYSGLEKCLWVVLGGIGVLILMAIFMKLGKPIRRVRRQLSNARPAPDETRLNMNSDDSNLDMGSLLHMSETTASTASELTLYSDPPPPYTECVRSSIHKYDIEEPPPRYSETFVTYTNDKDGEPTVHIRLQNNDNVENDLNANELSAELIANTISCNDSEDAALGMKTELVFKNGRIEERPSLHRNSKNNGTGVPNSDNVEEPSIHSKLLCKSRT